MRDGKLDLLNGHRIFGEGVFQGLRSSLEVEVELAMGYCVEMTSVNIKISAEAVSKALAAINALHDETILAMNHGGGMYGQGVETSPVRERMWYAWVENPGPLGFSSLVEALGAWRYAAKTNEDGSVSVIRFTGEKRGQDKILYEAIAPFVVEDGHILFEGEDGLRFGFVFRGGRAHAV